MTPYLLLSSVAIITIAYKTSLLTISKDKKNKYDYIFIVALYLIATLIAGFRFETGGDYEGYRALYEAVELSNLEFSGNGFLWALYQSTLKFFGVSFNLFLLINAILSNALILLAIRSLSPSKDIFIFSYSIYCLMGFYSMQMWYMRSGLSAGFLLLALSSVNFSKFKYLIFLFIAFFIHTGSFVVWALYRLFNFLINRRIILVIAIPLIYLFLDLLFRYFGHEDYINGVFSEKRGLNLKSIIGIFFFIYMIFYYKRLSDEYGKSLLTLCVLCFLIPFIFSSSDVATRFRQFLFPLDGIVMCIVFKDLFGKFLWLFAILIASIFISYIFWSNDYNMDLFLPYKSWLLN
jgi:hypothetical protein